MKKKLSFLYSAVVVGMLTAATSYALTPAEELTEALQEVIRPPLKSEALDLDIKVTDYRIVDGRLADFRVAYTAKLPVLELKGDFYTFDARLSQSKAKGSLGEKVMLTSQNTLDVKDKSFLMGQSIRPLPKEEWESHIAAFNKLKEDPNHPLVKEGVSVEFNVLKTNAKDEVEAVEIFFRPTEKNRSLQFDVHLVINVQEGSFTCNIALENNGRSPTVLDAATEKQLVEFLENLRKRDMATMMMAQSMIQLFKGYAGLALNTR